VRRERGALADRLRGRREDIEKAAATRLVAISDPSEIGDPEYLEGLHDALTRSLDYAIAAVASGEERAPAVPPALLVQARLAARYGVSLDTVLRRYFAGYAVLAEFLIAEAEAGGLTGGSGFKDLLQGQSAIFDRLLAAVSEEHRREAELNTVSPRQRRTERVKRLLAGELIDASELNYDLQGHHVGIVASGKGVEAAIERLAERFDKRLLLVREEDRVWAWLGSRGSIERSWLRHHLAQLAPEMVPDGARLGFGEPGAGRDGWRLTHKQALTALPLARRGPGSVVLYSDVALVASVTKDEVLVRSLQQLYLAPLEEERDGGEALRQTVRAYLANGRNITSAAAVMDVNRQTVRHRLRQVEEKLDCSLDDCAIELDMALKLERHATSGSPVKFPFDLYRRGGSPTP
jgi:hypothetical protein